MYIIKSNFLLKLPYFIYSLFKIYFCFEITFDLFSNSQNIPKNFCVSCTVFPSVNIFESHSTMIWARNYYYMLLLTNQIIILKSNTLSLLSA